MPIRELDNDQKVAATSTGAEVVVSAGAGSGKTSLLVGRYLHQVMTRGVPLQEIVAITFTNKAADQMKARIARRVPELVQRYPEHAELWSGLAERIHIAPISTIHSFCNSILRAYPLEAGIDPLFQVLDETTLAGLKIEAWRLFLDMRMDEEPERYGVLIRALGMRTLRRVMMELLERRAHVITYLDRHGLPDPVEMEEQYRTFILRKIRKYRSVLHDFHAVRPGEDTLSLCLEAFLFELDEIARVFEENAADCPAFERIRDITRESARKGSPKLWAARGRELGSVRGGLKECFAFLELAETWRRHERGVSAPAAAYLLEEFSRFEQFFLELKKSRSCLDNDDSLIETWRLLRNHPAVCRKVAGSFRHILVDEFQDTDDLQLDILNMITGDSDSCLFTVGDPKQSIYRFRGADVTVFNRFAARVADFKALRINYRSSPSIIAFVNHAFGKILGTGAPEHPFEAQYAEMRANRKDSPGGPDVDITVFDITGADACRVREAAYIAQRALEFHEQGQSYGEMALLLRKGTQARRYEEAFLRAGIPFVNLAGGNPFSGPEAHDIGNLLGWLCDPADQVLFTAVLLSPFFRMDADFLYALRRTAGKHGSLPEVFLREDFAGPEWGNATAESTRGILRSLLVTRDRGTIRELLEQAFNETGYTLTLLADPIRGEESLAILDLLLRSADMFEENGGSVGEFARLLRSGDLSADRAPSIETREDALTIITIHKSKGMEYPVVFLADASGKPRNESPAWLLHDELGPGFLLQSASGRTVKTLALGLAAEVEKRKAVAESKRLFYVACTRAVNRLVITGGRPSKTPDPRFEKDNWMGWLCEALGMPREGEPEISPEFSSWQVIDDAETAGRESPLSRWQAALESNMVASGPGTPDMSHLWYPPLRISGKPDTVSPTQAEDYLACPALYRFRHIHRLDLAFADDPSGGFGARYGQLAHHALELWDYQSPDRLIASVDALAPRDIPVFDRDRLKESFRRFSGSPLRRELSAAVERRAEERFGFILDDVLIRGTIDLAVRTGERWTIVDYKTAKPGPYEAAVEQYRFQVGVYALALHRAWHTVPERLIIHFLSTGVSREIPCDRELVEETAGTLSRIIESMDEGDFDPRPSDRCSVCPYHGLCGMDGSVPAGL